MDFFLLCGFRTKRTFSFGHQELLVTPGSSPRAWAAFRTATARAAIPASGLEVTRHWQRARGPDGAVYLWLGRRKRPGRPNRGSGLEFDALER